MSLGVGNGQHKAHRLAVCDLKGGFCDNETHLTIAHATPAIFFRVSTSSKLVPEARQEMNNIITRVIPFLLVLNLLPVANAQDHISWVLAYYMCYDNNLSIYKNVIINDLREGTINSEVTVTVLSDEHETDNLEFHELQAGNVKTRRLLHDNSASNRTFDRYLREVVRSYPANRYAIVFLNHGGRLDQMCFDENPGNGSNKQWLSSVGVGKSLRLVNKELKGRIALVFLQQCGRGTLESLYNFRDSGELIMASQFNVGAPNTYYTETLEWLGRTPTAGASQLAAKIAETDKHYRTYTTVDGTALSELPKRVNSYLRKIQPIKQSSLWYGLWPSFRFSGELYFDVGEILKLWEPYSDDSGALKSWLQTKLISSVYRREGYLGYFGDRLGLNLFIPNNEKILLRYADYPFYQQTKLHELFRVAR